MSKRGQLKLSFGVIFSVILIIIFVGFAIFGINKFLELQKLAQTEDFKSDLQDDINNMWKSTSGSQELEYFLPSKISQVCFIDDEEDNLYFVPIGKYSEAFIENINFETTIPEGESEFCIENENGKIILTIKKEFGESSVTITE